MRGKHAHAQRPPLMSLQIRGIQHVEEHGEAAARIRMQVKDETYYMQTEM